MTDAFTLRESFPVARHRFKNALYRHRHAFWRPALVGGVLMCIMDCWIARHYPVPVALPRLLLYPAAFLSGPALLFLLSLAELWPRRIEVRLSGPLAGVWIVGGALYRLAEIRGIRIRHVSSAGTAILTFRHGQKPERAAVFFSQKLAPELERALEKFRRD